MIRARLKTRLLGVAIAAGLGLTAQSGSLFAAALEDIRFAELPGDRFEVRLDFDSLPDKHTGYTIDDPARIVLDFDDVDSNLAKTKFPLSFENAKSAVILSTSDKTRLVLNLDKLAAYSTREQGDALVIEVGSASSGGVATTSKASRPSAKSNASQSVAAADEEIRNIDFRRGEEGEGKVIVDLSQSAVDIDVDQRSGNIHITFLNTDLPGSLQRALDVVDFATPVSMVNARQVGADTQLEIQANGDYDYLAYQTDNTYVVSVKPLTKQQVEERRKAFAFSGEKLSLNFQDIEVRSVLQLIADFTGLNLVASDTVTGNITLRLDSVPWDQALDLVLKTKGLDKRQVGNVLMVAPAAEIAERERQELETQKQLQELAPLYTEYVRVRYANAEELFKLFDSDENGSGNGGGFGGSGDGNSTKSILSERGSAIVDARTNSIILTDTAEKIAEFRKLIEQVDIPIRQVMIEARIVIANTDFDEELGVKWGVAGIDTPGNSVVEFAGSYESLDSDPGTPADFFLNGGTTDIDENLAVDLGVANPAGSFALSVLSDNILLGMELSALASAGHAELVSQPKVITGDKQVAHIQSGTEIPYQEATSSGASSTSFQEALLKLEVTPQITPDNHIIMDLLVNQDSVGEIFEGVPSIDTTELETQVLVEDGQTVVLGGIFQTEQIVSETKVPFLGDLPYIGRAFRQNVNSETKRELLIFITPRILAEKLNH